MSKWQCPQNIQEVIESFLRRRIQNDVREIKCYKTMARDILGYIKTNPDQIIHWVNSVCLPVIAPKEVLPELRINLPDQFNYEYCQGSILTLVMIISWIDGKAHKAITPAERKAILALRQFTIEKLMGLLYSETIKKMNGTDRPVTELFGLLENQIACWSKTSSQYFLLIYERKRVGLGFLPKDHVGVAIERICLRF